MSVTSHDPAAAAPPQTLKREIDWKGAFWAASGVPAGVLLTLGAVTTIIGQPSWVVWMVSVMLGFVQSFVYAEIAGLFPSKSGGASVYGAAAWLPYNKFVAPISVWCNWLTWSPVMALGVGLAASYVIVNVFGADSPVSHWELHLLSLDFVRPGLALRVNAVSLVAAGFLTLTFIIQHRGASRAANTQKLLALVCIGPLILVGLIPLLTGNISSAHLLPLLPLVRDSAGAPQFGTWNAAGVTLLMAAMFGAGWATYGFETAVCYTREFRDPAKDTYRAILSAGLLCIVVFTLVPLAFQGVFGIEGLLSPGIYDGSGVALALATMVHAGPVITNLLIVMFILALLLIVNSSMMGSSRTLYQASVDGWLPRYLSKVNAHGAPTAAMWTDLAFNMVLLLMSDYFAVLMISNVCYMIFVFLNLQSGWIHRLDRPHWKRPFRCPTWLLVLGGVLGFVNMVFVGAGADVWGAGTLRNGLVAVSLIVPVFIFRHYVQDGGVFPAQMREDMMPFPEDAGRRRAGLLPYLALLLVVALLWVTHHYAVLPQ